MKRPALVLLLALAAGLAPACDTDATTSPTPDADATDATAATDAADATEAADTTPAVHPALVGTAPAAFTVRPGVETLTVLGAPPGAALTLYDASGARRVTVTADAFGQAYFAYLPEAYQVLDLTSGAAGPEVVQRGTVVPPGDGWVVRQDDEDPPLASPALRVLAVSDTPDPAVYDAHAELQGVHFGLFGLGEGEDPDDGFNYVTLRDGVELGVMVRFPDPLVWGDGPWPTVIEYSGYSPSRPESPDSASYIATLLGYATVGVNMRGTGCSGGVFDVFSPAQAADGYDVIEVVARQPWVLHGHVGMVGISYPGISQLFVAQTRPPHLAAITPLSVIADPWAQLWPGGIYNDGFTRQWLEQRDAQAAPNGQSWTQQRIDGGDARCAAHQVLRNQNIAFESFFEELEFYPPMGAARSLPRLVRDIAVPVYLSGAWQDEQTGPFFAEMLGNFESAPVRRFTLSNGRHVDGFSPLVISRWWEFLELYVAERVPRLPDYIRTLAGPELGKSYDTVGVGFEPDRFADLDEGDYAGALARYSAEAEVRVLFESGAELLDQPGAPVARFQASYDTWPPASAGALDLYLAEDGALASAAPATAAAVRYRHDPEAGATTFFGPRGYLEMARLWDLAWTPWPAERAVAFETEPLLADLVLGGPGYAELWVASEATELNLQVTLSEIQSDGTEFWVQSGWHRVGHGAPTAAGATGTAVAYGYEEEAFTPLAAGEWVAVKVPISSVAHPLRAGSRLRVTIATPGRDHALWEFRNPDYDGAEPWHRVAFGGARPSRVHLSTLGGLTVPPGAAPCPSLRGQACRMASPVVNTVDAD